MLRSLKNYVKRHGRNIMYEGVKKYFHHKVWSVLDCFDALNSVEVKCLAQRFIELYKGFRTSS